MKSNAISVIEKLQKEGKIFNVSEHEANLYYYCAVLWFWFNHSLVNGDITMKSKTMDMHILMACNILLEKKHYNSSINEKIKYLGIKENAIKVFKNTVSILNSKNYLFERRGLYSKPKTERLIEEIQNATI